MESSEGSVAPPDTQTTLEGHVLDQDWTFAKADTSYLTHGLHDYPARMIPQIARRLIERYSPERGLVLDPFCGGGSTLVEARLMGRDSLGSDVNPFALLLAKVKSTPIDFRRSRFTAPAFLKKLDAEYRKREKAKSLPEVPLSIHPNLAHWFKAGASRDLEFLYGEILKVEDGDIRDLFLIVLSDTAFRSSNVDRRSSRFLRVLPPDKLREFTPDVLGHFRKKLLDSIERVSSFSEAVPKDSTATVEFRDARQLGLDSNSIDAVVTSPPYGEEKNTVGYARWSRLSIAWLRLRDVEKPERFSLGFLPAADVAELVKQLPSETARNLLADLGNSDPERVRDALPFFFDYLASLRQMFRVLKSDSFCSIVVGDRSIRQRPMDMDKVTVELAREAGFTHVESFHRSIPIKLIPWSTPTGRTISRESMVILSTG